jgi:hypothetical protein
MDPKDLKKRFEKKSARRAAESAQARAAEETEKAERADRVVQGQAALEKVVIPYFREIEATFQRGQFTFDPSAKMDAETHFPIGVTFKVGNGSLHFIEVIRGTVRIGWHGYESSGQTRVAKEFVYSSNAEPFIKEPSDLTRERLGKLVAMAIDED